MLRNYFKTAVMIALATISFQAIKAAMTNPVKSLEQNNKTMAYCPSPREEGWGEAVENCIKNEQLFVSK